MYYDFELQPLLSPDNQGKRQLLVSAECKLFSKPDDFFYNRTKIRKRIMEEQVLGMLAVPVMTFPINRDRIKFYPKF